MARKSNNIVLSRAGVTWNWKGKGAAQIPRVATRGKELGSKEPTIGVILSLVSLSIINRPILLHVDDPRETCTGKAVS